MRATDPAAGLALLTETFAAEDPDDRARLLGALATGLSLADEPLLEQALDDRRKEVRSVAADLLSALPGSALRQRMAERALVCVRIERRTVGRDRLVVTPPGACDAGMRRDGVQPNPPRGVGPQAWLLEEILARTPLDTWTTGFERTADRVLALPVADDWGRPSTRDSRGPRWSKATRPGSRGWPTRCRGRSARTSTPTTRR
ncbi:hypothetical protein Pflav_068650 [Phytohabitans flavus]|uniref:HEAT repeat domain-containing protein n=1 Tax=Phytohabitans flavus TaxID=1076124 RepID=A0A6F8Y2Y9_9ACTN|nr:hypothetical protein Pflav_068650 [Phytohabitans flavus]